MKITTVVLCGAVSIFALASGASAQTVSPEAARDDQAAAAAPTDNSTDDIVVFAQRRGSGESVQDVPMAVKAIDSKLLRATNSIDITDIGTLAPNVQTATNGPNAGVPNFSIRGIGINSSTRSVDPAVNIIQDGMVLAYLAGGLASTFDVESVEVLRGPQGVLFGRNATGGAVSLRTRRPQQDFKILADLSYDSFNTLNLATSVEGALGGGGIRGKIALIYRRGDGYTKNTNEGIFVPAALNPSGAPVLHEEGYLGGMDELTIKPTISFDISNSTQLTLFTQYQHFNNSNTVPRNDIPPGGLTNLPLTTNFGFTPTTSGYRTNMVNDGYMRLREAHVVAELVNTLGSAKITTVAAYRHVKFDQTINVVGSPFPIFIWPDNRERNSQWSIESRLNSSLLEGLIDLTAGLYYLNSNSDVVEKRLQANAPTAPSPFTYTLGQFDQRTEAGAAFLNLDINLGNEIVISAGGRYSKESKRFTASPLTVCPGQTYDNCPQAFSTRSKTWDDFSPRVVLNYHPNDDILLYASYIKGFRSGNFNNRVTNSVGFVPADPEKVTSYEVGFKSDIFDRTVRLNVSGFIEDYNDIQQVLTTSIPGTAPQQILLNAANARISGLEGELVLRPTRSLTLEANGGYTKAKFLKFNVPVPGVANPNSLKFARIPEFNFLVAATIKQSIGSLPGEFTARVAYDWRSSVPTDLQNTPELFQEAYGLLNANLSYDVDRWTFSIFGRNLTNKLYADVKLRSFAYSSWGGQPRTVGVRIATSFP